MKSSDWLWGSSSRHSHRGLEHKPLSMSKLIFYYYYFFLQSFCSSLYAFYPKLFSMYLDQIISLLDPSVRVTAQLSLFEVTGLATKRPAPTILSSRKAATGVGTPLLCILFETNPLDGKANQRLHVESQPLEIIYDAVSDAFQCNCVYVNDIQCCLTWFIYNY